MFNSLHDLTQQLRRIADSLAKQETDRAETNRQLVRLANATDALNELFEVALGPSRATSLKLEFGAPQPQ